MPEEMTPHEYIRDHIAHQAAHLLSRDGAVLKVFDVQSNVGPLGGNKSEFMLAYEHEDDGEVYAAMVVVYADANIERHLDAYIEEQERKKKRKRAVGGDD